MTPTTPVAAAAEAPARRRGTWLRFCSQFSLRTLLAVTTLAAIVCWWLLRPQVMEEELAGTNLTLRRQVRTMPQIPKSLGQQDTQQGYSASVGSWQVFDKSNEQLVAGYFHDDRPHGHWTLWHTSGRKAAEGDAFRGARTGKWRTWDEAGKLRSEVEYRASESRMAYGGMGVGGIAWLPPYIAERHGRARVWHATGALACEGEYSDDRRDGRWTWYDERGNLVEQGTYRADVREGTWITAAAKVEYVAGQPHAVHAALLTDLAADLASTSIRRQAAAAARLEELGAAGVPLLAQLLRQDNDAAKLLALRALVRRNAVPAELLSVVEPLADHADPRLALRAMLAVYQLRPERREALVGRIIATARKARTYETIAEAAAIVYRSDPERRQIVVNVLVDQFAGEPGRLVSPTEASPDPALVESVCRLGEGALPHLAAAFDSPRAEVREFVLVAIDSLVRRGRSERVFLPNGQVEGRWPLPDYVEQVLVRAKTDPDPAVRWAAESVGRQAEFGAGFPFGPVGSWSPPF